MCKNRTIRIHTKSSRHRGISTPSFSHLPSLTLCFSPPLFLFLIFLLQRNTNSDREHKNMYMQLVEELFPNDNCTVSSISTANKYKLVVSWTTEGI